MIDLRLITPPATEPVSLAEAKLHCRVDHDVEDAIIAALVTAARMYVEETTGRALLTQTWEAMLDAWPALLYLPHPPAASVVSVTAVDVDGNSTVLPATAYALRTGMTPGYVVFYSEQRPAVLLARQAGIRVRYVAGYGDVVDVPRPLCQAILLLVGHWYANREAAGPGNVGPLPFAVEALLAPYAVHWYGGWVR